MQHPERFLMHLNPGDHHILGFHIAAIAGKVAGGGGILDEIVVQFGEVVDHFGGGFFFGNFPCAGEVGEVTEAARGVSAEGADTFGDFIDGGKELRVLFFEGGVEGEETGAFDIPVAEVGLAHEGITVREHFTESIDDGGIAGGFLFGYFFCFSHEETLAGLEGISTVSFV